MILQIINTAAAFGAGVCTLRIWQLLSEGAQLKREIAAERAYKADNDRRWQQAEDDVEGAQP